MSSSQSPRLVVARRTLGDKLQEIGERSPSDLLAIEKIVDFVLARLCLRRDDRE